MRRASWLTAAAAVVTLGAAAAAQPARPSEYAVKAAYLHNFIRFVRWTRPEAGPIRLCVLGTDPFGPLLDSTASEDPPGGREVAIQRLTQSDDRHACHVLYVSASEEPRVATVLASVRGADVLTVSDMPGFVQRGGMFQFVTQRGRIRFDVQLAAAEAAGLTLSSDLLRVAREVGQ